MPDDQLDPDFEIVVFVQFLQPFNFRIPLRHDFTPH
jgi:hypothetical protein